MKSVKAIRTLLVLSGVLVFCASCTRRESQAPETVVASPTPLVKATGTPVKIDKTAELIVRWFEQGDSIFREAMWVTRKERPAQGRSPFGKMHRALLVDLHQKLTNKSLFSCDVYSMKRDILGISGVPQKAEVLHKCNEKESFIKIGEWDYPKAGELKVKFRGGNLSEVFGFATSILSPQPECVFKGNAEGILESLVCKDLMVDYDRDKNQILKFSKFEYEKSGKNILRLKAEVLENLDPVRKIEADVPLEGKILVTETVLQEPVYEAKQVPGPSVTPGPSVAASPKKENPQDGQKNPYEGEAEQGLDTLSPEEKSRLQHPQNSESLPPERREEEGHEVDKPEIQQPQQGQPVHGR